VPHLRQIMLEELRRRNYAESTIHIYIYTVEHFSRHFHRSPDQLGSADSPGSGRAVHALEAGPEHRVEVVGQAAHSNVGMCLKPHAWESFVAGAGTGEFNPEVLSTGGF
jgi:hypothetical protein